MPASITAASPTPARVSLLVDAARWTILTLLVAGTIGTWFGFAHHVPLVFAVLNRTLPLASFLLLILLLLHGWVGRGLGITGLFWHDRAAVRFRAACAVTVYLGVVATLMFLSYKIHPSSAQDPWVTEEVNDNIFFGQFYRFLALVGAPLLSLVLLPAVGPEWCPHVPPCATRPWWRFGSTGGNSPARVDAAHDASAWLRGLAVWSAGVLAGVLGFALVMLLLEYGDAAVQGRTELFANDYQSQIVNGYRYLTWSFLCALTFAAYSLQACNRVTPPVAICYLLGILAFGVAAYLDVPEGFAAWLEAALRSVGIKWFADDITDYAPLVRNGLLLGLLAWWCLVNQDNFKLRFPNMEDYYRDDGQVDLAGRVKEVYVKENSAVPWVEQAGGAGQAELLQDIDVLNNWLREIKGQSPEAVKKLPICERPKLAVVAVSGGAARAAVWAGVVLDRIEQMIPGFSRHVRIITGASGGMLGAAYYLKECYDRPLPPGTTRTSEWLGRIPRKSIEPVASFMAMRSLWRALLPRRCFRKDEDRGRSLEDDWEDIQIPLQDLRKRERAGKLPSMIISPMMIEDGRRLLISNLDLWDMTLIRGSALTVDDPGIVEYPYSLSALEFFRLFPRAVKFTLATAVRMSASFPFVSPAVNLPTDPPRRVVDAGYYDNYGIQVATSWVHKNRVWLNDHTSGVVLIQIRDAISQKQRMEVADARRGVLAWLARGFRFFTSPVDGASSARYASTIFRNDQDVWELSDLFDLYSPRETDLSQRNPRVLDRVFFTTIGLENSADVTFTGRAEGTWPGDTPIDLDSQDVALDWYLSDAERAGLLQAIPVPAPGSNWTDAENRLARFQELTRKVDKTSGVERDRWLKLLEQAKNYERLATLKAWWDGEKSPQGCGKRVAASVPPEPVDGSGAQSSHTAEDGACTAAPARASKPRCRVFGCINAAPTNGEVEPAATTAVRPGSGPEGEAPVEPVPTPGSPGGSSPRMPEGTGGSACHWPSSGRPGGGGGGGVQSQGLE